MLQKDLVKKLITEIEPPDQPPEVPSKSGPKRFTKLSLRIEDNSSKKIAEVKETLPQISARITREKIE